MRKRKKILIMIAFILFIILSISSFTLFNTKKNYTKDLNDRDQEEFVLNTLSQLSFANEIQEKIPVKEFYKQLQTLNTDYEIELFEYMETANNTLKEKQKTSFVDTYLDGHSFNEILYNFAGDTYSDFDSAYLLGDDTKEEYPESNVDAYYKRLLTMVSTAKYKNVIDNVDALLDDYKFVKPYNHKIANIYHDMKILTSKSNLSDIETLSKLYDPCVYTIYAMTLFPNDRYEVIEDKSVPYINASVAISIDSIETKEISTSNEDYKDYYKRVFDRYAFSLDDPTYTMNISKITFSDGTDLFDAYVVVNEDKTCNLYTIVPQNTEKSYESLTQNLTSDSDIPKGYLGDGNTEFTDQ